MGEVAGGGGEEDLVWICCGLMALGGGCMRTRDGSVLIQRKRNRKVYDHILIRDTGSRVWLWGMSEVGLGNELINECPYKMYYRS